MTGPSNITEFAATCMSAVEAIANDFDDPQDDFIMSLQVQDGQGEVYVFAFDPEFLRSPQMKEILTKKVMASAIIGVGGISCATVLSAWMAILDAQDHPDEIPAASEHPDRQEVVVVNCLNEVDSVCFMAPIVRDDVNPPTLGPWKEMPEMVQVEGRFFDPLRMALKESTGTPNPEFMSMMGNQ